jgi:hypothetical protein
MVTTDHPDTSFATRRGYDDPLMDRRELAIFGAEAVTFITA